MTITLHNQHDKLIRLIRFLIVGAGGTLLDFTVLTLLKLAGVTTLPANAVGFTAGVLNNYTWNSRWTYADRMTVREESRFIQFLLVSLVGLLLNSVIVVMLEPFFQTWLPSFGYLPAKVVATGVVVGWNFAANTLWTFRRPAEVR